MVVIVILFVCVFSSLSQGTNDFSNCTATKCMQCATIGTFGSYSQQIDCVVKNISEHHYEISCEDIDDNCSVVDIPPDEHLPRVCLYHLNFFNGTWTLLATNIQFSYGDTCDTIYAQFGQIMISVSPNCSSFFSVHLSLISIIVLIGVIVIMRTVIN